MARRSKKKFNNSFQVPNDKAEEILQLPNKELAERSHLEYLNWQACVRVKADDPQIAKIKGSMQDINSEVKETEAYKTAKEEFDRVKEELITEELARYKEELSNVVQPFVEDIKAFRNQFRLAMGEISRRKEAGSWGL